MISVSTVKKLISVSFLVVIPSLSQASVIWEQPIDLNQWASNSSKGYCSPCNGEQKVFASFHVSNLSTLCSLEFYTDSKTPQFSVSVWDVFLRGPMYIEEFLPGEYTSQSAFPNDPSLSNLSKISLNIPDWGLDPVDYYLNIYGLNGTSFLWGSDLRVSDDIISDNSLEPINHITDDDVYVSFKLSDQQIQPISEPSSLQLVMLGFAGSLFIMRSKNRL